MLLMFLLGCLEHVRQILTVSVNVPQQRAVVDAVLQDVSPEIEDLAALTVDEVVAKLKEEREQAVGSLQGGENVSARYLSHDNRLDLALHAEGSFAYWAADRGQALRSAWVFKADEWPKKEGKTRLFALWFESGSRQSLSLTGTGPFEVVRFVGDQLGDVMDVVLLRKGKSTIHADVVPLNEDGTERKGTGWVATKPGLEAAMKVAGLL